MRSTFFYILSLLFASTSLSAQIAELQDGKFWAQNNFATLGRSVMDSSGNVYSYSKITYTNIGTFEGDSIKSDSVQLYILSKHDYTGDLVWQKYFEGRDIELTAIAVSEDGYLSIGTIAKYHFSYDNQIFQIIHNTQYFNYKFSIFQLDTAGNYLWHNHYSGLSYYEGFIDIKFLENSNKMLAIILFSAEETFPQYNFSPPLQGGEIGIVEINKANGNLINLNRIHSVHIGHLPQFLEISPKGNIYIGGTVLNSGFSINQDTTLRIEEVANSSYILKLDTNFKLLNHKIIPFIPYDYTKAVKFKKVVFDSLENIYVKFNAVQDFQIDNTPFITNNFNKLGVFKLNPNLGLQWLIGDYAMFNNFVDYSIAYLPHRDEILFGYSTYYNHMISPIDSSGQINQGILAISSDGAVSKNYPILASNTITNLHFHAFKKNLLINGNSSSAIFAFQKLVSGGTGAFMLRYRTCEKDSSAQIFYQNSVFSTPDTSNLFSYQWYNCSTGKAIPGANGSSFKPLTQGSYSLEITNSFQCEKLSRCYEVTQLSTNSEEDKKVVIYPNPFSNEFSIQLPQQEPEVFAKIFSITGVQLYASNFHNTSSISIFPHLETGVYLLILETNKGKSIHKIVRR